MPPSHAFFSKQAMLLGLLFIFFLLDILFGSTDIHPAKLFMSLVGQGDELTRSILFHFRLPKAITCILAGAALALGGLFMQTLFRNPLAGPDVLGLSSGSSLMVALLVMGGYTGNLFITGLTQNAWSVALASSLGGFMIFLLMMVVAERLRDNTSLLIVGLMISAATTSLVSILQFISKAEDLQSFIIWSMGTVGSTNWKEIGIMAIIIIGASLYSFRLSKPLNAWLLGENYAQSLGINLRQSRMKIVIVTSLLTGVVTAFCGPIAFVGLAVPHLVKLVVPTTNHKILIPSVLAGGSILVLACDLLTQLPGSSILLPLNAITSLIGAPVVIWMILQHKQVRV